MKALLTVLGTTSSPERGSKPGLKPLPALPGASGEVERVLSWRVWTTGRPLARQAPSSRRPFASMSGLLRVPQTSSSKPRWTSIAISAVLA